MLMLEGVLHQWTENEDSRLQQVVESATQTIPRTDYRDGGVAQWKMWMRNTVKATKAVYGKAVRGVNKVGVYAAVRRVLQLVMSNLPNVSPDTVWAEYRERTYPAAVIHSIKLPSATNNSTVTLAEVFDAMASPSSPAPPLVCRVEPCGCTRVSGTLAPLTLQ